MKENIEKEINKSVIKYRKKELEKMEDRFHPYQFLSNQEKSDINQIYHLAKLGDFNAMYTLSLEYLKGNYFIINSERAKWWLKEAIKNGFSKEHSEYLELKKQFRKDKKTSFIYFFGLSAQFLDYDNPKRDVKRSLNLLAQLAYYDDKDAMWLLSNIYDDNNIFGESEKEESYYWLKKAAKRNVTAAQIKLAKEYQDGKRARKNNTIASLWLKRACDNDNTDAMLILGLRYYHGYGIKKDLKKACELWKNAADLGNEMAANNYAYCLTHGYGVKQNIDLAKKYFKLANFSNEEKLEALDELEDLPLGNKKTKVMIK